jgi:tyrosyl-tRNA synthetase
LKINDQTVTDERMLLNESSVKDGVIKLSLGKKKHVLLKAV